MKNKICLYAIAKNEAKNVDAWYESVKEADSIAVLDTGSTDGTISRLKRHSDIIVEQKRYGFFRFDQARNDSMSLIPDDCNICFTIDLDERLNPGWSDILRREWDPEKHNRGTYSYYFRDTSFEKSRNWIHSKDWSWLYPCHEAMGRNGVIWYQSSECLNLHGKIVVRHYPDRSKSRTSYLPLLEIRATENSQDGESFVYLIREYIIQRDFLKVTALSEKIKSFDHFTKEQGAAAFIYLGDAFSELGLPYAAMDCYRESIVINPEIRAGYVRLVSKLLSFKDKHLAAVAKNVLLDCLEFSKKTTKFVWVDNDDLWRWQVLDWLCVACYWSGEYVEAATYGRTALAADPGNQHILRNIRLCEEKLQNGR